MENLSTVFKKRLVLFLICVIIIHLMCGKDSDLSEYFAKDRELWEPKANRAMQPLVVTPIEIESDMGVLRGTQNGKTLFFFDSKIGKGKIILNNKEYMLDQTSVTAKSGHFRLSGSGVWIITTIPSRGRTKDNDDCSYVTFPYMIIAVGTDTTVLKDVEVQTCPHTISGPGTR